WLVDPRGWLLPRAHERLLHEVIGVRRVARHPVTQSPQESFVGAEDIFEGRGRETLRSGMTHSSSPYQIRRRSHRAFIIIFALSTLCRSQNGSKSSFFHFPVEI